MGSFREMLKNKSKLNELEAAMESGIAGEDGVLPKGQYEAIIESSESVESSKGTTGLRLKMSIVGGEFAGRKLWHELWCTPKALPRFRRDVDKLGIPIGDVQAMLAALDEPLKKTFTVKLDIVVRTDDDGVERSRIRKFDVVGSVDRVRDAFAPDDVGAVPSEMADDSRGADQWTDEERALL